jgi:hypothetical protein
MVNALVYRAAIRALRVPSRPSVSARKPGMFIPASAKPEMARKQRAGRSEILIVLDYPDLATHERAMKEMSQDADWQRVAAAVEKIARLQETCLTVITEEN